MRAQYTLLLATFLSAFSLHTIAAPETCSYDTYQWSTLEKRAVNRIRVSHPYRELTADEVDSTTGCTVCREDQVELRLPDLPPVTLCNIIAPYIEGVLRDLHANGEPLQQLVGYRVGRTRGEPDSDGLRTRFSNHSYGIAIDINPQHNGLYDNCHDFGPHCRLLRGGEWQPDSNRASFNPGGRVVMRFKHEGFKWGGEIAGKQKDFMHFSPSGY